MIEELAWDRLVYVPSSISIHTVCGVVPVVPMWKHPRWS